MTNAELIKSAALDLKRSGIEEYDNDAWLLFEHISSMSRASYILKRDDECEQEISSGYRDVIALRCKHIPLQYITGRAYFMGYTFFVNSDVLIPRFDTEILVQLVLDTNDNKPCKVLDMCTGSGCIATSLAKKRPAWHVVGTDISDKALEVAERNNEILGCGVSFVQSDLFKNIHDKFDVIVSNPPYISRSDIEGLMCEVKDHEPMLALCGGEDGLDCYKKLIADACHYLLDNGRIYLEIGYDQAQSVGNILADAGFDKITVHKDLAGLDRCISAVKYS